MRTENRKKQSLAQALAIDIARTGATTSTTDTRDIHPQDIFHLEKTNTGTTKPMSMPSKKLLRRWKKVKYCKCTTLKKEIEEKLLKGDLSDIAKDLRSKFDADHKND